MKKQRRKRPRPPRRQFTEPSRPPLDAFEVVFKPEEYLWPEILVPPLTDADIGIDPTDRSHPYRDMMAWLEAIVDGADMARWILFQESPIAQFIFLRDGLGHFDEHSAHLLCLRSAATGDHPAATACAVTPMGVVGRFYRAFRSFVESDAYTPIRSTYDPDDPDDHPDDHPPVIDLRQIRSLTIETALNRAEPVQLSFQVPFRPGRP